jgi:hypothetical protein
MKKIGIGLICFFVLLMLVACSGEGPGYDRYPSELNDGEYQEIDPGQLTAAELIDSENYEAFLNLFSYQEGASNGAFYGFLFKGYYDGRFMIKVTVKNQEIPLQGVSLELLSDNQDTLFKAMTNTIGIGMLFPKENQLDSITSLKITKGDSSLILPYTYSAENRNIEIDLDEMDDKSNLIEIMFVIDTTGSMSDELSYIKAEVDDVISRIKQALPEATIKLALLFYRDIGDVYVTRYFDFTENIGAQKQNLANQNAQGGGDWPEAVDRALDEAVHKNWSSSNSTKIIIHILDAPPHDNAQKMSVYLSAVHEAAAKGIRMIPVASSGVDRYLEFLLRHQALYTGGSYVFLTNDSGIGNDHLPPDTEIEYVVEYLNDLLVRVIVEQHTGVKQEKISIYQQQQ